MGNSFDNKFTLILWRKMTKINRLPILFLNGYLINRLDDRKIIVNNTNKGMIVGFYSVGWIKRHLNTSLCAVVKYNRQNFPLL